jgi:hypothetical protein
VIVAFLMAIALLLGPADAAEALRRPVVTVGSAFDAFLGDKRTVAGLGGGLGLRIPASEGLFFASEARWLLLTGHAFSLHVGAGAARRTGTWRPAVSLGATAYMGSMIRVVSTSSPGLARGPAIAVQAEVSPLRFVRDGVSAEVLPLRVGAGVEEGALAPAFGAAIIRIGLVPRPGR